MSLSDAILLEAQYRPGDPPRVSVRCRRLLFIENFEPVYDAEEIVALEGDEAIAFVRGHMGPGARWP